MTLTPPDFPDPERAQRTFRSPPDSRMTVPAFGTKAMNGSEFSALFLGPVQRPELLEQRAFDDGEHAILYS